MNLPHNSISSCLNYSADKSSDLANIDVGENEKRPQFGRRYLKDSDDVYSHNAWDHVEWDEDQTRAAEKIISAHLDCKMAAADYQQIEREAHRYWDHFYAIHDDKFYKDRHWLFTEFPELSLGGGGGGGGGEQTTMLEVGCGVGNTILPVLRHNRHSDVRLYGCDFSATAIRILTSSETFDAEKCIAFVHDITSEDELPLAENSVHLVLLIYALSSVHPDKMAFVLRKLFRCLKPGGAVLFRDYGRHDMSQLRFKQGRCISRNFYARGEGTLVYFFDSQELSHLFSGCGFQVTQIVCDKRLQVNRRKQLKMFRVWVQGKFTKPTEPRAQTV